jgi:uncharacterized protein YciI
MLLSSSLGREASPGPRWEFSGATSEPKRDLPAPLGGAPEIGGSLMFLHAKGTVQDVEKLAPYVEEEKRILAELHAEGVVKYLFRLNVHEVYLIVEADDLEDARKQVGRLAFVRHGLLAFEFEPVEKLI